jgi:hypothetical protein
VSRLFVLFALTAVCLASSGCGLFDTRNPEDPKPVGVAWIPPTEPETLFVDIKNQIEGKVVANFERCFVDTGFAFHPDPSDSMELFDLLKRDVFTGWDLAVELAVAQTLFDEASTIKLTFTSRDAPVFVSAEERIYFFKYELQVLYKVGGAEVFHGLIDYDVRSVGGLWYVSMWLDKRDPNFPYPSYKTWGYLKGTKRQL